MNPRVRTALLCVAGFVAAFVVVLVGGRLIGLTGDDGPETDAFVIADALAAETGETIPVRGFLFFDEATGPLLCSARTADDPPACDGSVMRLENVDPNRFDLARPENTDGAFDAYSRDEVVLLGTKFGAVLEVQDVLR